MLYRKKIVELRNWKANESVALLVEGARQSFERSQRNKGNLGFWKE